MERDFVGYADRLPRVTWPGAARIAVSIVINYEEGAEYSLLDGDRRELMGEVPSPVPPHLRDVMNESMFEYGSRVGIWRIWRILDRHQIPATIFACALALERNRAVANRIAARGDEVCGHGYRWQEFHAMDREAEQAEIARTVAALEDLTGQRPRGWFTRLSPSVHTRELVAAEGGFIYDSNAVNDDLPYYTTANGRPWLVVPYSLELNDARFWRGGLSSIEAYEQYLRDAFDCLYAEGAETPRLMSIGLHCRIAGTPARSRALARFLEYATGHEGVWFARRVEIARWWLANYPPKGDGGTVGG